MQAKVNIFIVLGLLCFLFNIYAFFSFKFKVASNLSQALDRLEAQNNKYFMQYTVDMISHIDNYIATNVLSNISVSNSDVFSSSSIPERSKLTEKSLKYDFYMASGNPVMRIGFQDFFVGDPFPRGGIIHRITYDSVLVSDGTLYVRQIDPQSLISNITSIGEKKNE